MNPHQQTSAAKTSSTPGAQGAHTEPRQAVPPTTGGLLGDLTDRLAFLKGFMGSPNGVASMFPSSRWLEQRIVRAARLSQARCVVELGPGTGGTTRALLHAMPAQSNLLAIDDIVW